MRVHLHVDLEEICAIGWTDAHESLDYAIVTEKVMYSSKKQSWLEVSKDLRLRAYPLQAMQNSAPSPENSLACLSLSLVASDRTLLWPVTYRTEGD